MSAPTPDPTAVQAELDRVLRADPVKYPWYAGSWAGLPHAGAPFEEVVVSARPGDRANEAEGVVRGLVGGARHRVVWLSGPVTAGW